MAGLFKALLILIGLVPQFKKIWDQLVAEYIKTQIDKMHNDDKEAIKKAVYDYDQRQIEWQLGNRSPGEHSFIPGTMVVDDISHIVSDDRKKK